MPEGRDRRVVAVDVAAIYTRRRASIFNDDSDPVIFESTPGPGRARFPHGSTPPSGSSSRRGSGRGSRRRSVLPSRYPRTPLRDITVVVTAPSPSASGAHLKHGASVSSPKQAIVKLQTPPSVSKILVGIIAKTSKEGSELTPEKLFSSIDTVEKAFREELEKFKRTPSAKKAERERKMRKFD